MDSSDFYYGGLGRPWLCFLQISRQQKIMTAKLIHQLVNTNWQSHIYYGDSDLCPCCAVDEETFRHVLSCPAETTASHRSLALSTLLISLKQIGTPSSITEAIAHGFHSWPAAPHTWVHALTAGQLGSTAAHLTIAFMNNFTASVGIIFIWADQVHLERK